MIFLQLAKRSLYRLCSNDINESFHKQEIEKYQSIMSHSRSRVKNFENYAIDKLPQIETYKNLHKGSGYIYNNWSFEMKDEVEFLEEDNFFEFGAGNGSYIKYLSNRGKIVEGVDLVNPKNLPNVVTGDFRVVLGSGALKHTRVIYSADFLEHLDFQELEDMFSHTDVRNRVHIHVIACYEDYVSHKTVMPPHDWAAFLANFFGHVEIRKAYFRRYPLLKPAAIIACKP